MISTKIFIPARYESSRFPGKPLAKIKGKEMIIRVAEICKKVISQKNIFVATDDNRIKKICKKYSINCLMTSKKCKTGTDRVFQASRKTKSDIIINVQGDEPLIKSSDIKKIIKAKKKFKNHVICGYTKVKYKDAKSRSVPKIIFNKHNNLIYISRMLIPGLKKMKDEKKITYYKQVCIYAFNNSELNKYSKLKNKTNLEKI